MNTEVFSKIESRGHEHVSFFYCPKTKLKAIVAIHNTVLGPALGGCRMRLYENEEEALEDVLRLSEGMTYKNSVAGLALGGGKACIIADRDLKEGREELFARFAEYLNNLSGKYYTAEDMGTKPEDMQIVKNMSNYVVGFPEEEGGSGDPSPWTAKGVFQAIKAISEEKLKKDLKDLKIAIQGIGNVGLGVAKYLRDVGAEVYGCDISSEALEKAKEELGVKIVDLNEIYGLDVDIFCPCAIGQTVNSETVSQMKAKVICGAANNQLSDNSVYGVLEEKDILYCPDFVVNAGGVISVGSEILPGGWQEDKVAEMVAGIYDTTLQVLDRAEKEERFTEEVALEIAKERIESKLSL